MSGFQDMLAADAAIFVNADEFGEAVVYVPRNGATRSISAQVQREVPEGDEQLQGTITPSLFVTVRNSNSIGISSAEVNTGGDKVRLAQRVGGATKDCPIIEVVSQDPGMMKLRLSPAI
jgi:hypothetical protein